MKSREKNKFNLDMIIVILVFLIVLILCFLIYNKVFSSEDSSIFVLSRANIDIKIGETLKIDYTISEDNISITWTSENDTIVGVDSSGYITGMKLGTTYVIGSAIINDEKQEVYCLVKV